LKPSDRVKMGLLLCMASSLDAGGPPVLAPARRLGSYRGVSGATVGSTAVFPLFVPWTRRVVRHTPRQVVPRVGVEPTLGGV
jgi:hypothetical protein